MTSNSNAGMDCGAGEWCARGKTLLTAEAYAEALEAFESAIRKNARLAEAYLGRGVCRYMLGQYRMAARDMDAATLLGSQDAQLWSRIDCLQMGEKG